MSTTHQESLTQKENKMLADLSFPFIMPQKQIQAVQKVAAIKRLQEDWIKLLTDYTKFVAELSKHRPAICKSLGERF